MKINFNRLKVYVAIMSSSIEEEPEVVTEMRFDEPQSNSNFGGDEHTEIPIQTHSIHNRTCVLSRIQAASSLKDLCWKRPRREKPVYAILNL
jgi:hypothetical protein